ncbi:hypothetical protein D3C79_872440 [compost metagenome]
MLADQRQPAVGGQIPQQHHLLQLQDLVVQHLDEFSRPVGQGIADLHQPVDGRVGSATQFQLIEHVGFG